MDAWTFALFYKPEPYLWGGFSGRAMTALMRSASFVQQDLTIRQDLVHCIEIGNIL